MLKNIKTFEEMSNNACSEFGEHCNKVSEDEPIREIVKSVLERVSYSHPGLVDIISVEDTYNSDNNTGESNIFYYVVSIHGGLNGNGEWSKYFDDMKTIYNELPGKCWTIDLKNDSLDDVWDLRFGFILDVKE